MPQLLVMVLLGPKSQTALIFSTFCKNCQQNDIIISVGRHSVVNAVLQQELITAIHQVSWNAPHRSLFVYRSQGKHHRTNKLAQ